MLKVESGAAVRAPLWNNMGVMVPEGTSIRDFAKVAGMDWTVELRPIYSGAISTPEGIAMIDYGMENDRAVIRTDRGQSLGLVKKDYEPIQNSELFGLIAELAEFDAEVEMETAGSLGKGQIVWALAKMPGLGLAMGNDKVNPYLLVTNGHGGNRRLTVTPTTVRVSCANTLNMALKGRKGKVGLAHGFDLKHTAQIRERLEESKTIIAQSLMAWNESKAIINRMAEIPAGFDIVESLIEQTFGKMPEEKGRAKTIATNRMDAIRKNWESPTNRGLSTENTLWTAMNSITEFIDHQTIAKNTDNFNAIENRFQSALIAGTGIELKESVFSYALARM